MQRADTFKSVYLALIVAMIGLKWLVVSLFLLERIFTAASLPGLDHRILAEIRILVPTAALLLGAAQVARVGSLRTHRGLVVLATLAGVFLLGAALAIVDALGLTALLDPRAALTLLTPPELLLPALLMLVETIVAWLFGAWIVGPLFFRRPGLDDA